MHSQTHAQPDAVDKSKSKADKCPSMLTNSLLSRHSMQSSMSPLYCMQDYKVKCAVP